MNRTCDAFEMEAGGWSYHLRALTRGRRDWEPFRRWTAARLDEWVQAKPSQVRNLNKQSRIIIFGPSAGYSLPNAWLDRFDRVTCVEPDLAARAMLRARFPAAGLRAKLDFLPAESALAELARGDARALKATLESEREAYVLFSNVLGQLPFLKGSDSAQPPMSIWADEFLLTVKGRQWASFHDVLSVQASGPPNSLEVWAPASEENWPDFLAHSWPGQKLEVIDHSTQGLGKSKALPSFWWHLAPQRWHLVAWVSNLG